MNTLYYILALTIITYSQQPKAQEIALNTNTSEYIRFCTCDVTERVCDINCCCDEYCTAVNKSAFTSCNEIKTRPDFYRCVSRNVLFLHNNPNAVVSESAICFEDTTKTSNYFLIPDMVTSENDYSYYEISPYSYESHEKTAEPSPSSTYYKYGDQIMVVTHSNHSDVFLLPVANSIDGSCTFKQPVLFLNDFRSSCIRTLSSTFEYECLNNSYANAETYSASFRFLKAPIENTSEIHQEAIIGIDGLAPLKPAIGSGYCKNVLKQVDYIIYHDGGVIQNVSVEFSYQNLSESSIRQSFGVAFRDITSGESFSTSGNPGYLIGKPLLAGHMISGSIAVDRNGYKNIKILAASGECNSLRTYTVAFGENVVAGCSYKLQQRKSCSESVRDGRAYLINDSLNGSVFIGSFGNSLPNKTEDWVPLLVPDVQDADVELSPPYTCGGLALKLEFLYAKVGAIANPQNRIIGAKISYEVIKKLRFGTLSSDINDFTLMTIVNFIEVTKFPDHMTQSNSIYSGRSQPGLFYPFIMQTSASCSVFMCTQFLFLVLWSKFLLPF